ncbi:hypothetical protein QCA50_001247 [Cerrena zonata]|uniref:Clathrin light chain n=1 Tax=Cerrena zonata TaxID=2478898 RepID=A0AAW0GYE5_9APHY
MSQQQPATDAGFVPLLAPQHPQPGPNSDTGAVHFLNNPIMDFTNINDPAGVKALLDRLRSSQAWQDTLQSQPSSSTSNAVSPSSDPPPASSSLETLDEISHGDASGRSEGPKYDVTIATSLSSGSTSDSATSAPPGTSVASLLSQLQAYIPPSTSSPHVSEINDNSSTITPYPHPGISASASYSSSGSKAPDFPSSSSFTFNVPPPNPAPSASLPKPDIRNYTFQQSLPVVAQLADDPKFIEAIATMKQEQAALETKLWNDRNAIIKSQEEKVKLAKTKAAMTGGAGLTQFQADSMSTAFKRELAKFDSERALPAWDGLLTKQQIALESLGVPTMFSTTTKTDRERQQRVIQVLSGFEN